MSTGTTVAPLPVVSGSPAELRAAARDHYRAALAAGSAVSGAELGRRFGMSARWGSARAQEVNRPPAGGASARVGMPAGSTGTLADPPGLADSPDIVPSRNGGKRPASHAEAEVATGVPVGTEAGGMWVRTIIRWVTTLTVILVAACAARASYDHQRRFVELAGETEAAWYLPLSVDGMMLVASLNMLVHRWDDRPAGWLTWCALGLGGVASLAANVAAAEPTLIGRVVAGWPPVCLLVSYELLMQQLPERQRPPPVGTSDP